MRKSAPSAAEFVPPSHSLRTLRDAARNCRGCDLYRNATQTVFGRGPRESRVMLVGEQPGDQEDLQGEPFVGPAGKLLQELMSEAGLSPDDAYVTNAVKHFAWEPRGTKRLHKKPPSRAVSACRPWLEAEVDAIHPEVVVCLGAVAAESVVGRGTTLKSARGHWIESPFCLRTRVTWHPSAALRAPDAEAREKIRNELLDDLRAAARELTDAAPTHPPRRSRDE